MDKIWKRWFYAIITVYFLGLIAFFIVGLGKITLLMFPLSGIESFKDVLEMVSLLATIAGALGLVLAAKTYKDAELEKKLFKAELALTELKKLFDGNGSIIEKKSEIIGAFVKFKRKIKSVPSYEGREIEEDLKNFCKTSLVKMKLGDIFKVKPEYVNIGGWESNCDTKKFRNEVLPKVAEALKKSDMFNGSMLNDGGSALDVLNYLIFYANKEAFLDYTYLDSHNERYWKGFGLMFGASDNVSLNGDQDIFSCIYFEVIPAAILYFHSFGRERLDIINNVK